MSEYSFRYDLSPQEIQNAEQEMAEWVGRDTEGEDLIYALWVPSKHPFANVIRTLEADKIPEMELVMDGFEDESIFLAILDARGAHNKVVHGARLSAPGFIEMQSDYHGYGIDKTGIVFLDDLIESGQGLELAEVREHYESRGVDLKKCIGVDSNFRVERAKHHQGATMADLGYIAMYKIMHKQGVGPNEADVFAHINQASINSFSRIGLEYEGVAGREDLKTPTTKPDGSKTFDSRYTPAAIPVTPHNLDIFAAADELAATEIFL